MPISKKYTYIHMLPLLNMYGNKKSSVKLPKCNVDMICIWTSIAKHYLCAASTGNIARNSDFFESLIARRHAPLTRANRIKKFVFP